MAQIDSTAARQQGGAGIVGKGSATADGPGPHIMAASTLDGNKVYSADDVHVGSIKDIMLDVSAGRIAYAVLSSGGFLGMGDKLVAIPWNALTLDTDRKVFILGVAADVVKQAEGFDKDRWPSFADAGWATELHGRYGTEPYWHQRQGERVVIDQPVVNAPRTGFSEGL
ncbi:PRC-barrel domain containing protein [Pigmentiphaga sp. H8]|uniref:PRC-barrel domain-containing protein n=1 Tax=unclassified Pigmentiphaga TaxID=2626614 RepID=UPI000F5A2965|nr:PRC-barrel domain-containing protein [Pigmentiphaga sp. H8]AZG06731.1 PRC-barrel domain containing protein [Pigmentiphaga sp. H8]